MTKRITDKGRLDWLQSHAGFVDASCLELCKTKRIVLVEGFGFRGRSVGSIRRAIDAAIRSSGRGK